MANKEVFSSAPKGKKPRPVTRTVTGAPTTNKAGGIAYDLGAQASLAQFACTGTLNGTYYSTAGDQLAKTIELASKVDSTFLAKIAIYSRTHAFMKDMPSLMTAILFARAGQGDLVAARLFATVFPVIMDNAKMVRNFVQMIRSGVTGRKSLGTAGKRVIGNWFASRTADQIFRDSVGNDPSLSDVIKLARPKSGNDKAKSALYDYLLNKKDPKTAQDLPALVKGFEAFKTAVSVSLTDKASPAPSEVPKVPFEMLTSMELTTAQWTQIALNGRWHFVRMNLNTFARHGVLKDPKVVKALAKKLCDPQEVLGARAFPYQLMMAYKATEHSTEIPTELKLALQDAMEIATQNVPAFDGEVWVFPDVSGSMASPITGHRAGSTTSVTCVDVAALVSASILRTSPNAKVVPFDTRLHATGGINPRDSVMTNATKLARFGGGGTNVSLCFQHLIEEKATPKLIVIVSDNESWMDQNRSRYGYGAGATSSEALWQQIKAKNPDCKLVCIDIQPGTTTQVGDERNSVLNVGGFSDQVFEVISAFAQGSDSRFWTEKINSMLVD